MKTPAEYLACPVFELTYPTGETAESVPVVAYDDAVRAVEAALADAEKYKYLLMRALRRSGPAQNYPPVAAVGPVPKTLVVPLYTPTEIAA
ncbi:hypothetical protein [Hymenobacter rigui]|uniref:Uncharacterized protein n=1 Tax=Hymenobacter rigui TaxID=334424 RepID=A0A3R9P392_9BACT|nr:hypothetical protein [Hymenobacter rigui]RSK47785.1 hypothetical protein EI291_14405 [Hymenobacter rigui]